jgi:ABC-type branched-subunit amino acid transport system substrate-binding protein
MNTPLKGTIDTPRAIAATVGLALVLGVSACGGGGGGGGNGPGSKQLNLVIGDSLPLSGTSKALGDSGAKASELAVDQVERAVEVAHADHTVKVVEEDQGRDADSAVGSANKLVDGDGASCLTGPWSSDAVAQTALDVAIPNKVLEISPVAASEDVSELSDHDLIDSTALPVALEGGALSQAIERDLGGAQGFTVNVAASNDSYGDTVTQDFIDAWQESDGTVGGQVVLAPPPLGSSGSSSGYSTSGGAYSGSSSSSSAYSAQAAQLASGSPDAVLVIDDLNGFTLLAPALASSHGWDPASGWGSDQVVSPGLPDEVGSKVVDGMRALAPGAPKGEAPTSSFVQSFKAAAPHSVKLTPFAAQEFDATVLCYLAAVAAGSTEGQKMADKLIDLTAPGGEQFSSQQLPDAIKALEDGKDIDYTGASGPIDMDVHGNPTSGVFDVYQYTSGGLELVGEVSVSKPNPATP